jgi:hypothetical protein
MVKLTKLVKSAVKALFFRRVTTFSKSLKASGLMIILMDLLGAFYFTKTTKMLKCYFAITKMAILMVLAFVLLLQVSTIKAITSVDGSMVLGN